MSDKRIVAAVMGDGHIGLLEQDVPELKNGAVLVEVHNSLISPARRLADGAPCPNIARIPILTPNRMASAIPMLVS